MCTSLGGKCLGEPNWAKFCEVQERLIKVGAKKTCKYTLTRRRNAARQQRPHQSCYQQGIKVSVGHVASSSQLISRQQKDAVSPTADPRRNNAASTKCPKKLRNLWILTCVWTSRFCQIPAFAAGLELLSLPYTIIVPAGTPGAVAWLGPNNHPAVWARRAHIKHKLFHCLCAYGYTYSTHLAGLTYVKGISIAAPQIHLVMHEHKDKESEQEYEVEAEYLWACKGVGKRWNVRADVGVQYSIFGKCECSIKKAQIGWVI